MTKKNFKAMTVAVFAIIAGYNVYLANAGNSNVVSDLLLANMEALSQNEGGEAIVSCSETCRDGIGKCWTKHEDDPRYCQRSETTTNYCSCAHLPG